MIESQKENGREYKINFAAVFLSLFLCQDEANFADTGLVCPRLTQLGILQMKSDC